MFTTYLSRASHSCTFSHVIPATALYGLSSPLYRWRLRVGMYFVQGLGTKSSRARVIKLALSLPYTVLPMAGNNENSAHHTLIFHVTRCGLWAMTRKQNLCEGGQDRERKGGESLTSPVSGVPNGEQSHRTACKGPLSCPRYVCSLEKPHRPEPTLGHFDVHLQLSHTLLYTERSLNLISIRSPT